MTRPQNTSHAVMAQRFEPDDSLDDFPTPPWASRALIQHVLLPANLQGMTAWEPACGAGHMAKVLNEYFGTVYASDIYDYKYGDVVDFIAVESVKQPINWIITNPPFRLAEGFIDSALKIASSGVAMLTRTTFLESVGRYNAIFSKRPPTVVGQFVERVPMVKGRLDKNDSTATGYCWLVWSSVPAASTEMRWIPPSRKELERIDDYLSPQQKNGQAIEVSLARKLL